MDDLFYDTADVSIALGVIEVAKSGGCFVEVGVRLELDEETRLR